MASTSFEAEIGSASTDGESILLTGSAATIHTATSAANQVDEVFIWASNILSSDAVTITVETYDGSSTSEAKVVIPPGRGYYLVWPGRRIKNGLQVRMSCPTTSAAYVCCNVNRITNQ